MLNEIRGHFTDLEKLIRNVKKKKNIFLRSPSAMKTFQSEARGISLLSALILTG